MQSWPLHDLKTAQTLDVTQYSDIEKLRLPHGVHTNKSSKAIE